MTQKTQEQKIKLNKTSDFLLPLFGRSLIKFLPYLVNAYRDNPSAGVNSPFMVYVLIEFSGKIGYNTFEKWMLDHPQYRGSYGLIRDNYTMYIMEIPDQFKDDYVKVIQGKYSHISPEAKKLILANRSAESAMPYILGNDPELRKYWEDQMGHEIPSHLDAWPAMNDNEETFNRDEFVKLRDKRDVLAKVSEERDQ